ncbi:hypothetical protein PU629_01705 [Pullulanibacillus sp. KACC 23026]|uniref:hypothetical protein n=1 Tax=Pullulanibacillus sp. KACC 23026 TaxID=3028315 RepID=UPI0023AF55CF|nr:hypothetical protein [Pullulanibacillus sp. KACC 23026]WEG13101.1 hypothetical protein PU629_01705 [Pullulanibacillus sp. KACC 23026]
MTVTISMATEIDRPKIKTFIERVGSELRDKEASLIQYLVAKDGQADIVGVLGFIKENETILLRHLVIDSKRCDMAVLLQIIEHAVAFGASNKAKRVLFLTPAPASLFEPLGFSEIEEEKLEKSIKELLPLEQLTAQTARVLVRELV